MVAAPAPRSSAGLGRECWIKIGVIAALILALNYWQFDSLFSSWLYDTNWQHGLIIPLFSLYLLYARRHELLDAPRKGCFAGLPVMILGILLTIAGVYPLSIGFVQNIGMIVVLFGAVWYVAGSAVIRLTWLPIWFLAFAMPWPQMVYNNIAFPLQNLAAHGAAAFLSSLPGVQISVAGSHLDVVGLSGKEYPLTVAEACSGIRSLVAFLALGVAVTYLEDRPLWQRGVLVLMIVPVAILCNVFRVVITCGMYVLDRPEMGSGFMHEFTGMLMLIPAFLLLWGISYGLKRLGSVKLFIEEDDEETPASDDSSKGGAHG